MNKLLISILLLFCASFGSAYAERDGRERGGASLDEAVEQVRERTGGRILSATTKKRNGDRIHRIKVLTPDRKVRVIRIPARRR
ncbi:PepSY domain-containing protein [Candidatus Reidiella endopervernicosa]|uniref:PepSY domain-containing protein n=1 Tax=Candidatus Reidiella endopervernicosa TaxID=2738883 RepID=A0A6N0HSS7_9GAMM|nr:PepSY domain-containing protein [Candidatus Reidiella endopervernicosa]QKQ25374.1 PepSY domain-containing protein [Candidatus Reidiella endopervernicosa]